MTLVVLQLVEQTIGIVVAQLVSDGCVCSGCVVDEATRELDHLDLGLERYRCVGGQETLQCEHERVRAAAAGLQLQHLAQESFPHQNHPRTRDHCLCGRVIFSLHS